MTGNRRGVAVRILVGLGLGAAGLAVGSVPASAAPGDFTLSTTSLSFANTYIGANSSIDITITNASSTAQSPNFSGGAPFDQDNFDGSQNCAGKTFAPGDTCQFTYEFTPQTAGNHSSNTTIGIDSDNFAITMSGNGLFPFDVSPTNLMFPSTAVGASSSLEITITNISPVAQSPNFAGGAPFDQDNFDGSQNCAGKTFPSGDTCQFTYEFTPQTAGGHSSNTTIGIDATNVAITMTGDATSGSATTTSLVSTTSTTSTTTIESAPTNISSDTTIAATAAPATQTLGVEVVLGPLSEGGPADVIATGIVDFPAGAVQWDHQVLDLATAPFDFDDSPAVLIAAEGPSPVLVSDADGGSHALLDDGEATLLNTGDSGQLRALGPDSSSGNQNGTATVHRIAWVPGDGDFSFTPGPGSRDVNLVRSVLEPGDRVHVTAPFPVLVVVTQGTVNDAPEGTPVTAGESRAFNDADLTNNGTEPAVVLVAAVGGQVP